MSLDRIFAAPDFDEESIDARWSPDGRGYTMLVPAAEGGRGVDIVRVDPETGVREVLVPAGRLVPNGASGPLGVDGYAFSDDGSKLLIFTNSKRVWRVNSRGDYWVLDRTSRDLRKLGGRRAGGVLDARQVLARRPEGRLRPREQPVRRGRPRRGRRRG